MKLKLNCLKLCLKFANFRSRVYYNALSFTLEICCVRNISLAVRDNT